jgi:cold shock CspA family protein/ribosome-associated translation inhibitor RaiA
MQSPLKIAYHGISPSGPVSERIRAKAARLERYFRPIIGGKVTLEGPGRHHRLGKHYHVRIELTVPGEVLVVGRDPAKTLSHQDLSAAVNSAFSEARRQLEDHARRLDHRARRHAHAVPARAKVATLFREDGYGFLETSDGREIYFDERCVLDQAFRRLRVGTEVQFAEEVGDKGPQASTVVVARRGRKTRLPVDV